MKRRLGHTNCARGDVVVIHDKMIQAKLGMIYCKNQRLKHLEQANRVFKGGSLKVIHEETSVKSKNRGWREGSQLVRLLCRKDRSWHDNKRRRNKGCKKLLDTLRFPFPTHGNVSMFGRTHDILTRDLSKRKYSLWIKKIVWAKVDEFGMS